jgi:hypothetical protein
MANVTEKPSDVNRLAGERGPEPAPLFVEPLSASVDLPMKRAVPRSPQAGLSPVVDAQLSLHPPGMRS